MMRLKDRSCFVSPSIVAGLAVGQWCLAALEGIGNADLTGFALRWESELKLFLESSRCLPGSNQDSVSGLPPAGVG